jgi:hypothetical protein
MDDYKYVGWVPCVNGHLDFGLMKVGIKGGFTNASFQDDRVVDLNCSLSSKGDSHQRGIVLQSKVDWRDSEWKRPYIGQFRVLVTAKVKRSNAMDDRNLSGNVLIYPLVAEPECKTEISRINVHEISHGIDKNNIQEQLELLDKVVSSPKDVTGLKPDCLICSLHFTIRPNGLTYIKYNESGSELDPDSSYIIARQIFYYLKYSIHSHRHHIDEQDSLTTITPCDSDSGLRLVCQLKRELTNLSRTQKIDNRRHPTSTANGIISYTNSLLTSLVSERSIDSDSAKREAKYFDNVKLSFDSMEDKIKQEKDSIERAKSKAKVWLGFGLIYFWSVANFIFNISVDTKIPLPHIYMYVIPLSLIFAAACLYIGIVNYYRFVQDQNRLPLIYGISSWTAYRKIILGTLLFLGCLFIAINGESEGPFFDFVLP